MDGFVAIFCRLLSKISRRDRVPANSRDTAGADTTAGAHVPCAPAVEEERSASRLRISPADLAEESAIWRPLRPQPDYRVRIRLYVAEA